MSSPPDWRSNLLSLPAANPPYFFYRVYSAPPAKVPAGSIGTASPNLPVLAPSNCSSSFLPAYELIIAKLATRKGAIPMKNAP